MFPNPVSPSTSRIREQKHLSNDVGLRRSRPLPRSLESATQRDLELIGRAFSKYTSSVTFPEFLTCLREGISISEEAAHTVFESIDVSNTFSVSWADFCSFTSQFFERDVPVQHALFSATPTSPSHSSTREIGTLTAITDKNLVLSCGSDGYLRLWPALPPSNHVNPKPKAVLPCPGPPSELPRKSASSKAESDLLRVSVDSECIIGQGHKPFTFPTSSRSEQLDFCIGHSPTRPEIT
ncbi:hypothetical protein GEMRC1_002874 [Eukaryota sp. GEM-RC1]